MHIRAESCTFVKLSFPMDTPLVSICCLVYNHEPFLRECFEGFVMQKTTFPIEVLVHDDASTDHSADIIREYTEKYPDIFKPIFQTENQYSKGNGFVGLQLNFERAQGKYIAMCEGDDYWTDPLKLQKQVDFLEGNEEYSMCFHKVSILSYIPSYCMKDNFDIETRDYSSDEVFEKWIVPTCSIVCRKEVCNFPIKGPERKLNGDIFLVLSCAAMGKLRGMTNFMGTYRIHSNGVTYNKLDFVSRIKKTPAHLECIKDNFPLLSDKYINLALAKSYITRSAYQDSTKRRCIDLLKAIKVYPSKSLLMIINNLSLKIKRAIS